MARRRSPLFAALPCPPAVPVSQQRAAVFPPHPHIFLRAKRLGLQAEGAGCGCHLAWCASRRPLTCPAGMAQIPPESPPPCLQAQQANQGSAGTGRLSKAQQAVLKEPISTCLLTSRPIRCNYLCIHLPRPATNLELTWLRPRQRAGRRAHAAEANLGAAPVSSLPAGQRHH